MALSHRDVAMMNDAIQNLGNIGERRNLNQQRQTQLGIENDLRERSFDLSKSRLDAEMEGNVEAWLQGDDGGVLRFHGPKSGLDQVLSQAAAKGKKLQPLQGPPTTKPQYGSFKTETPFGEMEFQLRDEKDLSAVIEMAKKVGGSHRTSSASQDSVVARDREAALLEQQASQETDPVKAQSLRERATTIRSSIRQDPASFETSTTTEKTAATPEVSHKEGGFLGIGGRKVVTQPAQPEKTVRTTKRIPVGAKQLDPATAKKFLEQAGGDKEKARELARQAGFTF